MAFSNSTLFKNLAKDVKSETAKKLLEKKQEASSHYWKDQLKDITPLSLRTDFSTHTSQAFTKSSIPIKIDKETAQKLHQTAKNQDTTLSIILLTSLYTLLYRYSNQTDLCVGSSIKNNAQHYVNQIPLRANLSGNPAFNTLLNQVKCIFQSALNHQEHLTLHSNTSSKDDKNDQPYSVTFAFNTYHEKPQLKQSASSIPKSGLNYFNFILNEHADGSLDGVIEFNANLFKPTYFNRLKGHLNTLWTDIIKNPTTRLNDLSIHTTADKLFLAKANNTSKPAINSDFIHEIISKNAKLTPNSNAIVFHSQDAKQKTITYKEFDRATDQLAAYLQHTGVKPETAVGISINRSIDLIVAFIAIFKAGGVAVPLDTKPSDALKHKISNTKISIVLTDNQTKEMFSPDLILNIEDDKSIFKTFNKSYQKPPLTPENLAYIIYTSGSTGNPKGVMIEHRGLINMADILLHDLTLHDNARVLCTAPPTFDAFIFELLDALLRKGGQVHLLDDNNRLSPDALRDIIQKEKINAVTLLPKVIGSLKRSEHPSLKRVITMGAVPDEKMTQEWMDVLYNGYGPSEATIGATIQRSLPGKPYTCIGTPFRNYQVMIVNENNECPIGVPGELVISTPGLARGYLNDPAQTKEKFPTKLFDPAKRTFKDTLPGFIKPQNNAFPNHAYSLRIYKTGDLGVRLEDGTIDFIGRIDRQIKINGVRIELDGMEALLRTHPDVKDAIVEPTADKKTINVWLLPTIKNKKITRATINSFLDKSGIPIAAKPATVTNIDKIPLTKNGKIDKAALPTPEIELKSTDEIITPPTTELQKKLHNIWVKILLIKQPDSFGIESNFSDLGGDSFALAALEVEINKQFSLKKHITIYNLIFHTSIAQLEKLILPLLLRTETKDNSEQSNTQTKQNKDDSIATILKDMTSPRSHPYSWEQILTPKNSVTLQSSALNNSNNQFTYKIN